MDYEKKYKEALERARQFSEKPYLEDSKGIVDYIFPELKEGEDEQHRKWILEYLYDGLRKSDEQFKGQFKCAISWLEKQGQDGKVWFYRDDYVRDKKQAYQDGIDNVLNNPQKYGLEKREIKEHDVCDTCDEKASCVNPCPTKLIGEQKPAWSEEEEYLQAFIIELLYGIEDTNDKEYEKKCRKAADWLKSLRPQNSWKPDELQLKCLSDAISNYNKRGFGAPILKELLEQLKTLREE